MLKKWTPPASARPYLPTIYDAERANGIPTNMLARLLDQESHYRPDIISGKTTSGAGAIGIAQIVPKWHPGVDPTDPQASIWYAANYLASLHAQFGTWQKALAAYNWGPGNLNTDISNHGDNWRQHLPSETAAYVTQIGSDVGYA